MLYIHSPGGDKTIAVGYLEVIST